MRNKIVIAGAGHGGIVAARELALQGFEVHVYEKKGRDNLSWDWRDNMELDTFQEIGIPEPKKSDYLRPENLTFLSPDEEIQLESQRPMEEREITIERRFLINYLIDLALDAGASVQFNQKVIGPLIEENVVHGIRLKNQQIKADLIIDSTGIDAVLRTQLPKSYKMDFNLRRGELFHTYRGYFNKNSSNQSMGSYYKVILGYQNKRGIAWVNTSNEYADVLIGCIDPFKKDEIESLLDDLRSKFPEIGKKLIRGGQIAPIPIRRTAPLLVGANFALIGDAAWMTKPVTGSGISNSMIAGKILADITIKSFQNSSEPANENYSYSIEELWKYQYEYYKKIGADNGFVDVIKDYLMTTSFENMNFIFHKKLITADDLEAGQSGEELDLSIIDGIFRLFRSFPRFGVIIELASNLRRASLTKKHFLAIPEHYDEQKVASWINKGKTFYEGYYKKLEG